jgi:hypothetical protein
MTHGILSGTIVLKGESGERFNALLADLHAELQPQTIVEITLVENMAVARWRQMRIWGIEKANMEHQMRAEAEATDDVVREDTATRCALAFRTLSDESHSLELINRYEARYDRQYLRAHRRFLELVDRRTPPPAPAPRKPDPPVQSALPSTHGPQLVHPAETPPATGHHFRQTNPGIRKTPASNCLAVLACALILAAFLFIPAVSGPILTVSTAIAPRENMISPANPGKQWGGQRS